MKSSSVKLNSKQISLLKNVISNSLMREFTPLTTDEATELNHLFYLLDNVGKEQLNSSWALCDY